MTIATTEPCDLSATEAAAAIKAGTLTSEVLVESCLARIAARDETVKAFAYLDADGARAAAREADAAAPAGLLHGVPVALKDIIDAYGMPTGFNSPIYPGYVPFADSACAAMIRDAGGIILGKTVTTEFANRHPGPTTNPHDRERTPGGSSSGSAAAVASGMVPLAVGTQTSGSIIRPAAYCGVVGYKPSFNEISRVGVKQQSGSLDTIGTLARSVADIALFHSVLTMSPPRAPTPAGPGLRVALCRTAEWADAAPDACAAVEACAAALDAVATVTELTLPPLFDGWSDAHRRIANYEAARNFGYEKTFHREKISKALNEGRIMDGEATPLADYADAQRRCDAMRAAMDDAFCDFDVILTLSAAGEAPKGLAATGSAGFNSLWTMLYTPCITLPWGLGVNAMPLGIQLVGRRFEDDGLFAAAMAAEALAPKG